jgi:hypothetical protein
MLWPLVCYTEYEFYKIFPSVNSLTGPATHTVSYPILSGDSAPDLKRPKRKPDHSHPTIAENAWSYTSVPQFVFIDRVLIYAKV